MDEIPTNCVTAHVDISVFREADPELLHRPSGYVVVHDKIVRVLMA